MNRIFCLALPAILCALTLRAQTPAAESHLLTAEGKVQVLPVGVQDWSSAVTNQTLHIGDRLRTGPRSRATIRLSDLTVLRVNELTTLQISPPEQSGKQSLLDVKSGSTYFFSRERPAQQEFRTPLTSGAIRGTEFNLAVADDGRTVVTLIDGAVTLSNTLGQVDMGSGDQGIVDPGKPPVKTAMLEAINIIQWCLYYPGVLDSGELELSADQRRELSDSLVAYNSGDLLQAAVLYPTNRVPASDSERVYRAATLLSVGQAEQAEAELAKIPSDSDNRPVLLATALREVISVVKGKPGPRPVAPSLATEWLAESYYYQSQGNLAEALKAARASIAKSPNFGFGWARVAELELSFGHLSAARDALDTSLQLSPRNAQSLAVKGFILLAQGHVNSAQGSFQDAIDLDGALGNAWVGRGLCRIHRGDSRGGLSDLQVAAVLEPQRSVLRSYLGKGFSNLGDNRRGRHELGLAQKFDPNDPTSWLYLALVNQDDNRINEGVRDLEKSEQLNHNERIFRSRLLLDEDQAVRSANLANIYQDAGMFDWSLREASRAVDLDYANYSAHQFLANSYDVLRDPNEINLRYETPWFSELLLTELLAPVSAANLSEFASEQDHARLFEGNYLGISSYTEYTSHGDWLERASLYGTFDTVGFALDDEHRSFRGWRTNNDRIEDTVSMKGKDQITPHDSIFIEGQYFETTFGDTAQYYNQYGSSLTPPNTGPDLNLRGSEREEPNIFLGFDHEWDPGIHTLFLAARLNDTLRLNDSNNVVPFEVFNNGVPFQLYTAPGMDTFNNQNANFYETSYERQMTAYSFEAQQIWQTPWNTLVGGGRYQFGKETTFASVGGFDIDNVPPLTPIQTTQIATHLQRYSLYAYDTAKPCEALQLTLGVSYDRLRFPRDIDTAPIIGSEAEKDQLSPKAGIMWSPFDHTHLRAAFTRSLGGVFDDTSVRLEPVQVAGFTQAYRSVAPESVIGLVPGTRITTYGVGLDQSLESNTYLDVDGEILESHAYENQGVVTNSSDLSFIQIPDSPGTTRRNLDYREETLSVSLNQLLGDDWALGARYQISHSAVNVTYTDFTANNVFHDSATLQRVDLYANYNLPCGFFAQGQALWMGQKNLGDETGLAGANFWQFNAYAGYRFFHRDAEIRFGVENIGNQDYLLNPVNLYNDLPRDRTFVTDLKIYF